jgi:hypothetical protein
VIEMKDLGKEGTQAQGLSAASVVFDRLRVACRLLSRTDDALIRSTILSIPSNQVDQAVAEAVRRYAEEHCLVAEVAQSDRSLVIRLRHPTDGDAR